MDSWISDFENVTVGTRLKVSFGIILKFSKGHKLKLFIAQLLALITASFIPFTALCISIMFGKISSKGGASSDSFVVVYLYQFSPLVLMIFALVSVVLFCLISIPKDFYQEQATQLISNSLRETLYQNIEKKYYENHRRPTGELMRLLNMLPDQVGVLARLFGLETIESFFSLIWSVCALYIGGVHDPVTIILFLSLLVLFEYFLPMISGLDRKMIEQVTKVNEQERAIEIDLNQQLSARNNIYVTSSQKVIVQKMVRMFQEKIIRLLQFTNTQNIKNSFGNMSPLVLPIMAIFMFSYHPKSGFVTEQLMIMLTLTPAIIGNIKQVVSNYQHFLQVSPLVLELDKELNISSKASNEIFKYDFDKNSIEICNLSTHSLQGNSILKGLNLFLSKEGITVIAGAGGSGKSHFLEVLAGHFDGQIEGELKHGEQHYNLKDSSLYRHLYIRLCQEPDYVPMRIIDYIYLGLSHEYKDEEKAIELLKKTGVDTSKFNLTDVLDRDYILSSVYEKHAFRITQLLVRKLPPVLLLDEVDSGMPVRDAKRLIRVIEDNLQDKTKIITVTHHPYYYKSNTELIFFDSGQIDSIGTHEFLMNQNEKYRKIYNVGDDKE